MTYIKDKTDNRLTAFEKDILVLAQVNFDHRASIVKGVNKHFTEETITVALDDSLYMGSLVAVPVNDAAMATFARTLSAIKFIANGHK